MIWFSVAVFNFWTIECITRSFVQAIFKNPGNERIAEYDTKMSFLSQTFYNNECLEFFAILLYLDRPITGPELASLLEILVAAANDGSLASVSNSPNSLFLLIYQSNGLNGLLTGTPLVAAVLICNIPIVWKAVLAEKHYLSLKTIHLSLKTIQLSLKTNELSLKTNSHVHLSLKTIHLSLKTIHLSLKTNELSLKTNELSLKTIELSLKTNTFYLSLKTNELSLKTIQLSLKTIHLSLKTNTSICL